jgi:nickel-dependent lactate racemase
VSEWVEPFGAQTLVRLPYGKGRVETLLPSANLLAVASPRAVTPRGAPAQIVRSAMQNPVGGPPLRERVKPGQSLLVLVDDLTRPTPVDLLLPLVLDELEVEARGIRVTRMKARWLTWA